MNLFIETIMVGRGTHATDNQRRMRVKRVNEGASCCYCNIELNLHNSTLEHKIPAIIVRASKGKIPNTIANITLACGRCNNERSIVTSKLGDIWKSKDMAAIRSAATALCNLVRKREIECLDV